MGRALAGDTLKQVIIIRAAKIGKIASKVSILFPLGIFFYNSILLFKITDKNNSFKQM
jgi:hypothetical protein